MVSKSAVANIFENKGLACAFLTLTGAKNKTMEKDISRISELLNFTSISQAVCKPVDRHSVLPFLNEILNLSNLERKNFIVYNFVRYPKNYSVRLMSCLPELWEVIDYEDLLELVDFARHLLRGMKRLIEFTHKFLEINIFPLLYLNNQIPSELKSEVQKYFLTQTHLLLKDDIDESLIFYNSKVMGIELDVFNSITSKLLNDERILKSFDDLHSLKNYLHNINCL